MDFSRGRPVVASFSDVGVRSLKPATLVVSANTPPPPLRVGCRVSADAGNAKSPPPSR